MEGSHPFWINPDERAGSASLSVEIAQEPGVRFIEAGLRLFLPSQLDARPQFTAQLAVLG
jgi:hypothetical protein